MSAAGVPRGAFEIAGAKVAPGERATLALQLPGQSAFTSLSMPLHVVHGRSPGPVLFVSAAIHGDEINGVEIIRQLRHSRALARLRGTLVCIRGSPMSSPARSWPAPVTASTFIPAATTAPTCRISAPPGPCGSGPPAGGA